MQRAPHPFRRRRDLQRAMRPFIATRDGILQRAPDGHTEHKRRLAHGFGTEHGFCGVARIRQQLHAKIMRDIRDGRDFVGGAGVRQQAPLPVPHQLLRRHPAHALHEPPFHLPDIQRRIQRSARIVQDVDPLDLILTGQRIHRHFRTGRAVHKVIKRLSAPRFAIVMNARHPIVARGRQRDLIEPRQMRDLGKRQMLPARPHDPIVKLDVRRFTGIQATQQFHESLLDDFRRLLGRFTV